MMTLTAADLRPVVDDVPVPGPRAERPRRRAFTAEYKARVLAEYEAGGTGEKGAVLRREALTEAGRAEILRVLGEPRFADKSVAQVWATLFDEGVYLASRSTMHRVLRAAGQGGERRRQAAHPARVRPELLATGPQQVWSWDITKLRGPERGSHYDLYVILDIYSRYVVGWTVAATEDSILAKDLIAEAIKVHGTPGSLHADRGTSMTSKPVAQLLTDLGVARSHSRPHLSNDNPYSEAAFKTLKYAPVFPDRFGSLPDARAFCDQFVT